MDTTKIYGGTGAARVANSSPETNAMTLEFLEIAIPRTGRRIRPLAVRCAFFSLFLTSTIFGIDIVHAAALEPRLEVLNIEYHSEATVERLAQRFSHMDVDHEAHRIVVETNELDRAWLKTLGLSTTVNLRATAEVNAHSAGKSLQSIPDYGCYRTVEETQASVAALIAAHPDLASAIDIGDSWEKWNPRGKPGYDLIVLKLTNSAIGEAKPKMFVQSSIHGREYTPAELNTRFAEWLLDNYGTDPQATWLLDHNEFHLLLHANPDGRKEAEAGEYWRKNTDAINGFCTSPTSIGVDLNRNFPFHWGGPGTSTNSCSDTFLGPGEASEPETRAIVNYLLSIFPDLRPDDVTIPAPDSTQGLFLDVHSNARMVLWPWGDSMSPAPNGAALEYLGRRIAWFTNYRPQQSIALYATSGTGQMAAYGQLGVPALTLEIGTAFFENCTSFESHTFPENFASLLYAARTLHSPYTLPSGPDVTAVAVDPDLAASGETVRLRAVVDDSRLRRTAQALPNPPPIPNIQNIAGASATVDQLPWEGQPTAIGLLAADGNFDSAVETTQVDLPVTGLTNGKHLVYVQGRGANGALGPPQAAYVEIAPAAEIATVHGTVRDAISLLPVAAKVNIGASTQVADATGAYDQRLHPGSVDFKISARGYATERLNGFSMVGGSDLQRDFLLSSACTIFQDDAEGPNPGWIAQGSWGISTDTNGTVTQVWTDSPTGNYANNLNVSLTTPLLNLSSYRDAILYFDHKCRTEAGYDFGHLEFSLNGDATNPTYTEVFRCDAKATYESAAIELPQLDNQSSVRLRWRLTSDDNTTDDGWSIDNIRLEAGGTACHPFIDQIFRDGFD